MSFEKTNVFLVGGGKGAKALLKMFLDRSQIKICGVADIDEDAPGMKLAKSSYIPTGKDFKKLLVDISGKEKIDEIINLTGREDIQNELLAMKLPGAEVIGGHSAKLLWDLIEERGESDQLLKRNFEIQNVINALLRLSLENISLDVFLQRALEMFIRIPWLFFESKGVIFLVENDPNLLVMKAQSGLSESILMMCANVPFEKCLCGLAASTRRIQFKKCLDEQHEIRYEGILDHGHYCVPIAAGETLLGVMTLYLKPEHQRDERDEAFLLAFTNALAGVIQRKRVEEELKTAFAELKETQGELIQSEKLAALGRFSSGIAHEVKNPLGIILGGIEFLERESAGKDEKNALALQKMKEALLRADHILLGLLKFSRPSQLTIERVPVKDLIEDVLSFYNYRTSLINIHIRTETAENLYFEVDKNQIQQALLNVFMNAVEALPQGGEIAIKSYRMVDRELPVERSLCVIEIKDSGTGISKDHLTKIVEPFFTTKRDKKGTGLGLAVTKMIIENHKGEMLIDSELNRGTTVRILLPCAAEGGRS
ncbi:MAG: ATP-binding protein [Candidatus Omnitrophota bacterium]